MGARARRAFRRLCTPPLRQLVRLALWAVVAALAAARSAVPEEIPERAPSGERYSGLAGSSQLRLVNKPLPKCSVVVLHHLEKVCDRGGGGHAPLRDTRAQRVGRGGDAHALRHGQGMRRWRPHPQGTGGLPSPNPAAVCL